VSWDPIGIAKPPKGLEIGHLRGVLQGLHGFPLFASCSIDTGSGKV
jgi:hypothetical protein